MMRKCAHLAWRAPQRQVRCLSLDPWDAIAVAGALGITAYAVPRLSRMLRGRFSAGSVYAASRRDDQIVLLLESEQAAQESLGASLPMLGATMRRRLDGLGAPAAGDGGDAATALAAVFKQTARLSRDCESRGAVLRATEVVLERELLALLAPAPAATRDVPAEVNGGGDAAAHKTSALHDVDITNDSDGAGVAAGAALDSSAAPRLSGELTAHSVFRLVTLLVTSGVVPRENWPPHFSEPANVAHVLGSEVWHAVRGRSPGAIAAEEYDADAHQALCCALLRVCAPGTLEEDEETR